MPLDLPIAVWCLAIPSLLAAVGGIVSWRVDAWQAKEHDKQADANLHGFAFGVGQVVLGLSVAFAAMSSLQASVGVSSLLEFQEQAWCQLVWGMLLAALLGFTTHSDQPRHSSFWVTSSLLAIATAFAIMPSGDSWNDALPQHRYWLPLVAMAAIANHWALRQLVVRDAGRWVALVALASLAGPLLLCAASYSALLNVCLAVSTTVAIIAIAASLGFIKHVQGILLPAALCGSAMSGSAKFFSYDEPSAINYGLAMFMPVIVDAIDRPLRQKPTWLRVVVAGSVCSTVVLLLGYRILGSTNKEW